MNAATATTRPTTFDAVRAAQVAEGARIDVEIARLNRAHWSQIDQLTAWARTAEKTAAAVLAAV